MKVIDFYCEKCGNSSSLPKHFFTINTLGFEIECPICKAFWEFKAQEMKLVEETEITTRDWSWYQSCESSE